ncbi:MAG: DUF4954 family protein [Spirochaetes bacterium]|nr:DUF4954 family protein [Spirochaetota bacterium]
MNDIKSLPYASLGFDFVPPEWLPPGADEYHIRDTQLRKPLESYRPLDAGEIETLVLNANSCTDWARLLVRDPFDATLVRDCEFSGLVRIGTLSRTVIEHHDLTVPAGLSHSRIVSCDIGDGCAIHDCSYIAHYLIGDECVLIGNNEIHATNHAKFGNGIVMEGESEDVRVWIDVMNEAGGRSILPFDGMICADAYLWAKRRGNPRLLERFREMTQSAFDLRRGRYGEIGDCCVIKHNRIIKDVRIGPCAYVKGANKLKNLTINSSETERTQIGEGVELVNGIIGYGCRVFYGCKAVRFVIGNNTALKYGARLIHSVLGDNSSVSCCEMLNNLVFPAHEQHHNTSFLIAALVRGQSNMAAGATVGSNHNSRSNDGEIDAGRGFWPGLSTSLKHSSRFASYALLAKGDYPHELDLPLPFCLVNDDRSNDRLELLPAYWWLYNMYALMRNESKFAARDMRLTRVQAMEFSPFAPDTAEEMFRAIALLEEWAGRAAARANGTAIPADRDALRKIGADLLSSAEADVDRVEVLAENVENSGRPVVVLKAGKAWKAYRRMIRFYAVRALVSYLEDTPDAAAGRLADLFRDERITKWENLGGFVTPRFRVDELERRITDGEVSSWKEVHACYDAMVADYPADRAEHAYACLRDLDPQYREARDNRVRETRAAGSPNFLAGEFGRFVETTAYVEEQVFLTRRKDYDNRFRKATFEDEAEMAAVMGEMKTNPFVLKIRDEMEAWRTRAALVSSKLFGNAAG